MRYFIHQAHEANDTIAAIATPPGEGGIAVIRISGKHALHIANAIFSGDVYSYPSHSVHFGKMLEKRDGDAIDSGLLLVLRAPRSFTGEDTVEMQCHGGPLIAQKILQAALDAGARAAEPGEFTFRAFRNGKLDLAQAEAVQQCISAKSDLALQAAEAQLEGHLSTKIHAFQKELTECAAIVEAYIDFPDDDLPTNSKEELCQRLGTIVTEMHSLAATFHEGRLLRMGPMLSIVGPPNVGKSSLMNALLRKNRAIVTDIPGTTRDLIEEECALGSFHVRLVDTAGIRATEEVVEREGIRRAELALKESDLILLVLDAHVPYSTDIKSLIETLPKARTLLLWNKVDLPHADLPSLDFSRTLHISAMTGMGLDSLKTAISECLQREVFLGSREEILLTKERHYRALCDAQSALEKAIQGLLENAFFEIIALNMRFALSSLGTILGTDITEDILSAIFSQFCIGK